MTENPILRHRPKNMTTFFWVCLLILLLAAGLLPEEEGWVLIKETVQRLLILLVAGFLLWGFRDRWPARFRKAGMLCSLLLLLVLGAGLTAGPVQDLAEGPQTVRLSHIRTESRRGYRSLTTHYYLTGETPEGETLRLSITPSDYQSLSSSQRAITARAYLHTEHLVSWR